MRVDGGAACLAGLAMEYWESQEEIASQRQAEKRFEAGMPTDEREQRLAIWRRAVQRARTWITESGLPVCAREAGSSREAQPYAMYGEYHRPGIARLARTGNRSRTACC